MCKFALAIIQECLGSVYESELNRIEKLILDIEFLADKIVAETRHPMPLEYIQTNSINFLPALFLEGQQEFDDFIKQAYNSEDKKLLTLLYANIVYSSEYMFTMINSRLNNKAVQSAVACALNGFNIYSKPQLTLIRLRPFNDHF